MEIADSPPAVWPGSIRGINALPETERNAIYRVLLPSWVYEVYGVEPATLTRHGQPVVHFNAPRNSRSLELSLYHNPLAQDPLIYLNLVDTLNNQLMVLLLIINDPDSSRFDVDRTPDGVPTCLGTRGRNIAAEVDAMRSGLAPGQIRAGLRRFKLALPIFETFVGNMGHDLFLIEPFAYHNAITFERYGFGYITGRRAMEMIDQDFRPGGQLHARLDGSTPFRSTDAWRNVRLRSWAIHDGILERPFTGFQMVKRLGIHAGINTFPDGDW